MKRRKRKRQQRRERLREGQPAAARRTAAAKYSEMHLYSHLLLAEGAVVATIVHKLHRFHEARPGTTPGTVVSLVKSFLTLGPELQTPPIRQRLLGIVPHRPVVAICRENRSVGVGRHIATILRCPWALPPCCPLRSRGQLRILHSSFSAFSGKVSAFLGLSRGISFPFRHILPRLPNPSTIFLLFSAPGRGGKV
jgi:hypothetical protein